MLLANATEVVAMTTPTEAAPVIREMKEDMDKSRCSATSEQTAQPSVARFTPGPWWYQEQSDAYTHIVRAGERRFITQLSQDRSGTAEANARLIAAAPELYAALLEMMVVAEDRLSEYDVEGDECEIKSERDLCPGCREVGCIQLKIREARAALAKASPQTGE